MTINTIDMSLVKIEKVDKSKAHCTISADVSDSEQRILKCKLPPLTLEVKLYQFYHQIQDIFEIDLKQFEYYLSELMIIVGVVEHRLGKSFNSCLESCLIKKQVPTLVQLNHTWHAIEALGFNLTFFIDIYLAFFFLWHKLGISSNLHTDKDNDGSVSCWSNNKEKQDMYFLHINTLKILSIFLRTKNLLVDAEVKKLALSTTLDQLSELEKDLATGYYGCNCKSLKCLHRYKRK